MAEQNKTSFNMTITELNNCIRHAFESPNAEVVFELGTEQVPSLGNGPSATIATIKGATVTVPNSELKTRL